MKYRQLTKEQLESLHQEFSKFLASQGIDAKEWADFKKHKPQLAIEEIDIFSDLVWDNVLNKTKYVDHFSKHSANFFKFDAIEIHRIAIKVSKEIDLQTKEGFDWLLKNLKDETIEIFTGTKKYKKDRNLEIFELIEMGAIVSNGNSFEYFYKMID